MTETMPTIPMVKVQYNVPKTVRMPNQDLHGKKLFTSLNQLSKSCKVLEKLAKERRKSKWKYMIKIIWKTGWLKIVLKNLKSYERQVD